MLRSCSWLLLFISLPAVVLAQQASTNANSMPGMNHLPYKIIDGKDHPEQIPDVEAYRMFLLAATVDPNPKPADIARQKAFLSSLQLDQTEQPKVIALLRDFRLQYGAMIEKHNAREEAIQRVGGQSENEAFLAQRDAFVQKEMDQLKLILSPEHLDRFHQVVQSEKKHMKITAKEGQ